MSNEEKIFSQLNQMNATLVRLTVSVEEHVRRTDLLETKVEKNEASTSELKIKNAKLEGGLKTLTLLGSAFVGLVSALKYLGHL